MALLVDIRKTLGSFRLDVCFETENQIMAILGTSGCGKSMTLKCIAGIETPDEGRIVLDGKVLFDSEKKINLSPQQRHVGYMFQDYALFPNMTVLDNIAVGLRSLPKEERMIRAREYAGRFQVGELTGQYPSQLSGGQKQRVAMARMLAAQPEVIMLDEPFSALDSHLKWILEQEVKSTLRSVGKTTLFVSHSRDEVYRICDTVTVMDQGKADRPMTVKELFENPGSRRAALISGCRNIAEAEKVDDHTIRIPGWNCTLIAQRQVPDDLKYAGVRAHYFHVTEGADLFAGENAQELPTGEKGQQENRLPIHDAVCTEEPFEWNVAFLTSPEQEVRIQWRVSKDVWSYRGQDDLPTYLYVNPEDILLMTE